jgi:hypothetical protein
LHFAFNIKKTKQEKDSMLLLTFTFRRKIPCC